MRVIVLLCFLQLYSHYKNSKLACCSFGNFPLLNPALHLPFRSMLNLIYAVIYIFLSLYFLQFLLFFLTDWERRAEWLGSIIIFGICLCLILEMLGHGRIIYFFIPLSLIAGSQRQSNIWSSSHDWHCWQSNILPANSCGSWPCAE